MEMVDMRTAGPVVGMEMDTPPVVAVEAVVGVLEEGADVGVATVVPDLTTVVPDPTTNRMALVEVFTTMPLCHHRDEVCDLLIVPFLC